MTDLPDGWVPLEVITITKADEEGTVRLHHHATDGLNSWEAFGMCTWTPTRSETDSAMTTNPLPCKACGCALADCDAYGEGCCPSCQRDTMHEPSGVHTCTNPALCPLDPLVEYRDLFTGEIVTAPRSQVKLGARGRDEL